MKERNEKIDRFVIDELPEHLEIVNDCIKSYIMVYGEKKWNSLNAEEQHDVVMTACSIMLKALN